MLAADLLRAAGERGIDVVAAARDDLDVTDAASVSTLLERERPDTVVNCAAYTDVDGAEDDLEGAMAVNAAGARNVATAAAVVDAPVVYVSTDYVFDGSKGEPYVESDTPRPLSVYGQSKLAGEHETASANPRHVIVRSSWLFGAGGGNFVETMLKLAAEHGEARVVDDQVGCPTYTGQLAGALLELAGATAGAYGVHHVAGGGACSWYEFALEVFEQADVECATTACASEEFPRAAARPAYSELVSEHPDTPRLPSWREGLGAYLAQRPGA